MSRPISRIASRWRNACGTALAGDLPYFTRDGGFIAAGYDPALDELRQLATDTKVVLAKLQAAYAAQTGIKTLKIQYNQVFGYFVEASPGTAAASRPSRIRRPSGISRRWPMPCASPRTSFPRSKAAS